MSCYIVGAGAFFGFSQKPGKDDYVIAADGGYAVCLREGIDPDCVLGDFDSLGRVPATPNTIAVPVEKDDTDTMLAVKKGLEQGFREFHIYGGTGGRLDHTIANLQTLLYLAKQDACGWLYDRSGRFTVLRNGKLELPARQNGIFSVFAVDGDAEGVTIRGGQYTAEKVRLTEGFPMGVSNHFVGDTVCIQVENGALLVGVLEE